MINRSILAGIRGCKKGNVCLGNCPDCTIQKIPLMINPGIAEINDVCKTTIDGIFVNLFDVSEIYEDSYINDIAEM